MNPRFVKKLDLGIADIEIEPNDVEEFFINFDDEVPDPVKQYLYKVARDQYPVSITTIHHTEASPSQPASVERFNLDRHESEGTKKLFYLAGPLLDTLSKGRTLVIDELDARLHPLITCVIIHLFNSNETNRQNAQLIFTTHDTNLLSNEIFRRDQLWFAEKNRQGATDLYSLVEFKIRNDASFEKDYIKGKYGAIPFLGDISQLLGDNNGEKERV